MFYVREFKALYTANSGHAWGFAKHARLDATTVTIARTASRHNRSICCNYRMYGVLMLPTVRIARTASQHNRSICCNYRTYGVLTQPTVLRTLIKIIPRGTEWMNVRMTIPGRKYILTCLVQGEKNDSPIELSDWPRTVIICSTCVLRWSLCSFKYIAEVTITTKTQGLSSDSQIRPAC